MDMRRTRSIEIDERPLAGTACQYEVREAVNPKRLCGSYYRALTPSKIGA